MRTTWNHFRLVLRDHATTITFLLIAVTLATTLVISGVLAAGGSPAGVGERPTFSPMLVHNATTSDNPFLLLLAAIVSP